MIVSRTPTTYRSTYYTTYRSKVVNPLVIVVVSMHRQVPVIQIGSILVDNVLLWVLKIKYYVRRSSSPKPNPAPYNHMMAYSNVVQPIGLFI